VVGFLFNNLNNMKKIILSMFLLGALLNVTAQVPNYVPSNGLVGWWPFSGNANDQSGNGLNGTVTGATLITDRFGNANSAYSFNGLNNSISVPHVSALNFTSHSISFWYFRSNVATATQVVLSKGRDINTGTFVFYNGPNESYNINGSSTLSGNVIGTLVLGNWENRIVTYDATANSLKLFINGVLANANLSVSPFSANNTSSLTFGMHSFTSIPYFFNGKLDDIGIWNRALTQQEITNLYNGNICFKSITVTDTLVINVNRTSYNPLAYANTIKVYPNPTNDKITIDNGDLSKMAGYSIKIYNSIGQQLFQSNINQQQFSIDISQWGGNGLYFMELKDNNGNIVEVKKIVLQ